MEDQRGLYSVFHWRNVFYIMDISKQRNGQFTMRFIFSFQFEKRFIYNGDKQQRNGQITMRFIHSLPLGKRFIYNGDKQTEKWAVHKKVYIQSSIGETFYI